MATLSQLHLLGERRGLIFSASLPRKLSYNATYSKVFTYSQASAVYNQLVDFKETPLRMQMS